MPILASYCAHTALMLQTVCFPGHSPLQWSIVVSIFCAGAPFGSTLGGIVADIYGRKKALLLNSLLHTIAGITLAMAPNIMVLMVGR
jgi:MFS family permease